MLFGRSSARSRPGPAGRDDADGDGDGEQGRDRGSGKGVKRVRGRVPERFDITRPPNPHLAFSRGTWHCIGAPMAQMEIEEVFRALLSRMPALRLTIPLEELAVRKDEQARCRDCGRTGDLVGR
jgi:hypothetical protein